jgi:hypothetical protein
VPLFCMEASGDDECPKVALAKAAGTASGRGSEQVSEGRTKTSRSEIG